jgi:glycine/D-amino acid oxidase-like deaminating enzyme
VLHQEMLDLIVYLRAKCLLKKCNLFMEWRRQKSFLEILLKAQIIPRDIIKEYNIDCDVTGDSNFVVAHHKNKFEQIKEQAEVYKSEFGIETEIYSKEEFNEIGHGGTEQYGAFSYKPGFAINPLKFVNGIAKYALSKKLKIFEHTKVDKIDKENGSYILRTKEGSIRSKKIVVATNGFYQEGINSSNGWKSTSCYLKYNCN